MSAPLLSLRGIRKQFGAVEALAGVDLDVRAGEVHAVVGENGAGKSTLMKIIYGLLAPDAGAFELDGHPAHFASALDARRAGIGMVHQEFALVDALSVAENLALSLSPPGEWLWRRERVIEAARRLADRIGLALGDLDVPAGEVPVGLRQRIEIVKALAGNTRVLILDEPTAVLTPAEAAQLIAVLDRLRTTGTAVVFITHKLAEVSALADLVTIMRRGQVVARVPRGAADPEALARLMIGELPREGAPAPGAGAHAELQLRLAGITLAAAGEVPTLSDVSVDVYAGEVVAIAGVDGNGQAELFEVLAGLRAPTRGSLTVGGRVIERFDPAAMIDAGVACIPPDRQRQGVVGEMSVAENAALNVRLLRALSRGGMLDRSAQRAAAQAMVDASAIVTGGLDNPARCLSGGNLQKLVVARALALQPRVLVAANPTRGLDVAAALAVQAALATVAKRGAAVLLISTDLDEVNACANRLAVLYRGRLSRPLGRPFAVEQLGGMFAGSEAV
ncbi:MAG: ABC transporter ATP-binding protein [Candidatus Binatia bacterium]